LIADVTKGTERSFTIDGEFPEYGFPPPQGKARLTRDESLTTTTYTGDVSDCARLDDTHLACRFATISLESSNSAERKTSTVSGWVHAEVVQ
jgi:hypothetical protein